MSLNNISNSLEQFISQVSKQIAVDIKNDLKDELKSYLISDFGGLHWEPLAYSVKDAAKALGLGRVSIYDLMNQKQIRYVMYNSKRLIPRSELEKWLLNNIK